MDALDRILPLAGLLWPVLECDVSISRDPATGDAAFRARVFDVDHPDGLAAKPLAEGTAGTPSDAAEALASHLATLARPRLDALLRAAGDAPSQRADLADDVARLERAVADLTRDRDRADRAGQRQREVLATPEGALGATMQRATTMLSGGIGALLDGHVSPSERADLRPELAALATMIRRTLRAWDVADAGAEVLPLKRTGGAR